jgi:hypothetical protein
MHSIPVIIPRPPRVAFKTLWIVNEIKLTFVFGKLLCLAMHLDLCYVIQTNKTQHGNQACHKLQQVERGALEVGRNECSAKFFKMSCMDL